MSSEGERQMIDVAELRRCIALSFSTRDLRELCEGLGASGIGGFDRGIQDAAREVVRHFERQGQLPLLVQKLAEARPLMEWPNAPKANPAALPAPMPEAAPLAIEAAPMPEPAPAPVPAPEAAPAPAPVFPVAPAPAPASGPVLRDPYAAGWPSASQPVAPKKAVEGRKLTLMFVIGGVVVAVAAVGAFMLGRSGAATEGPAPLLTGKDAQAKGERPLRESGPARLAADAVSRSFGRLARSCDLGLAPNAPMGAFLFKAAYEECGKRSGIARPPGLPPSPNGASAAAPRDPSEPDLQADPSPSPIVDATPRAPRTAPDRGTGTKAPTAATADKAAPSSAADACMSKCASSLKGCNSSCGAEPTSSSQYGPWQACKSNCLVAVSKCRQACQ